MNMEQLYRIFLSLAEHKNFSRVAEKLHISQPAISQHIKNLEALYDVSLFTRSKKIVLTPSGEALVPYAEKILSLYKESFIATQEQKTSKTPIKIGTSLTIGNYILPQIIFHFNKNMVLNVKVEKTKEVIRKLLNDEIEVALVLEDIGVSSLKTEAFAEDEIILILSPQHPWANKTELGVEDLSEANFVIMESGSHKRAEETLRLLGIELTSANSMEIGDTEALKSLVESGLGVGIVFYAAVKREVQMNTLKILRIAGHKMTQKFYWVTKSNLYSNKNVEMLKEIIFSKELQSMFQ